VAVRSLRRVWIVIYGANAPEGEIENARKIARHIRSRINLTRVYPDDATGLDLLTKLTNVVTVGGPLANEWTFKLNNCVNPKWDITVLREKKPEETWDEYIKDGGIKVNGFLKNATQYSPEGRGMIGIGRQVALRARPLRVVSIGGWRYCDTCVVGQAFRENAGAGIFETGCTEEIAREAPCPAGITYVKIADP